VTQLVKEKNQLGELLQQLSDVFHGLSDTLEAGTLPGVGINQEQLYSLSDVAGLDVRSRKDRRRSTVDSHMTLTSPHPCFASCPPTPHH
jgi:hypothetical protein